MTAKWTSEMLRGAVAELRRSRTVVAALPAIEQLTGFKVTSPALHAALTARNLGQPSDYVGADYDDGLGDVRALRRVDVTSTAPRNGQRNVKPVPPPAPEVAAPADAVAPTDRPPAACPGRLDAMGELFGTCVLPAGHEGAHEWRELGQAPPFEPMPWHDVAPPPFVWEPPALDGLFTRLIVPDTHGMYAAHRALDALARDLPLIAPREIVYLGDHSDCDGFWSSHQPSYADDLEYEYGTDIAATDVMLSTHERLAPNARRYMLQGNHELRIEKTLARLRMSAKDARAITSAVAPEAMLKLKQRGYRFVRCDEFVGTSTQRGAMRLGTAADGCWFFHGARFSTHATVQTLKDFNESVCHGHTHRAVHTASRTVGGGHIFAACPGTLSELAPRYKHTHPSTWAHGYAVQVVEKSGRTWHYNVPIIDGVSQWRTLLQQASGPLAGSST